MSGLFPLLAYRPFLDPLPVWDYWLWLLVPLCLGVSLVYKSIREPRVERVPVAALKSTFWILLGMGAAAAALVIVVGALER